MEFVRVIKGYNHLWAVKNPDKELDELTSLFEQWNDANYLFKFFRDNIDDLKSYFKVERVSQAIQDTFEDSDALEDICTIETGIANNALAKIGGITPVGLILSGKWD